MVIMMGKLSSLKRSQMAHQMALVFPAPPVVGFPFVSHADCRKSWSLQTEAKHRIHGTMSNDKGKFWLCLPDGAHSSVFIFWLFIFVHLNMS